MKKAIFILLFGLFALCSQAQQSCSPALQSCSSCELNCYIVLPFQFVKKYQIDKQTRKGVNQFNATQTVDGCWVTSCNTANEFPELFSDTVGGNPNLVFPQVQLNVASFGGTGSGTISITVDKTKQSPLSPALTLMGSLFIVLISFRRNKF